MKQRFGRVVVDGKQLRCGSSLLKRFGYHHSDVLAVMHDAVILQRWWRRSTEVRCWSLSELASILVGDDSEHTWSGQRRCCVDVTNGPGGYGALNKNSIRQVWEAEIRGVMRGTGHFAWTINAMDPWTDEWDCLNCCHDSASNMVKRARTMVRLASSTLKALSRKGVASASAASAAARNISTSAWAPRRIFAAVRSRQGTGAP